MARHILIASFLACTSSPAPALPANFKTVADKIIADAAGESGPGYAVVVTENGNTAYRNDHGLAKLDGKTAITPQTSFRYASITKQFTAAAIMKLVDEGKVALDDPLTEYLPDYPGPGGKATVRQLLDHTSGIMPYTQIPSWAEKATAGKSATTQSLIDEFKAVPLQFEPGQRHEYNNSGYVLLGAILEKVTGKSWDEAVIGLVTRPLGLASIKSGIHEADVTSMASGYTDEGGKAVSPPNFHMSNPHAAGALVGTADDLARWAHALHSGQVLSAASYAAMTSRQKLSNGDSFAYGFGLVPGDVRGRKSIGHDGNIFGFSSGSIYVVEPRIFVAVLANSDALPDSAALARRLAAAAIGDPFPVFSVKPVDSKAVGPMLGIYSLPVGERVFLERNGKLFTRRSGGGEREVFPVGENRFFYGGQDLTWFAIRPGRDGKNVMEMHHDGATDPELSTWAGPVPAEAREVAVPIAVLDQYVGTYAAPMGAFEVTRRDNKLMVKLGGQPAIAIKAISETEFEVTEVGAKLTFGEVVNGKAKSFSLNQGGQTMQAHRQ